MSALDDRELAAQKYAEVQYNLDVNKTLPWQLSIDTLTIASKQLATPETERFLDDFLFRVTNLMTSQSLHKLGQFEKNVIEDSIMVTIEILLKILPKKPQQLPTLGRLLDVNIPFYSGNKSHHVFTHGYPQVRLQAIKKFVEGDGFVIIVELLRSEQFVWPGSDTLLHIVRALNMPDVLASVEDNTKAELVTLLKHRMLTLPDEQLKRENTDVLAQLIPAISWICKNLASVGLPQHLVDCRKFCFEFTLKMMNSGSLVLRLFAWEQLNDLILDARNSRPIAGSYIVSGAGSDFVNGVYTLVPAPHTANTDDQVRQYQKPSSGAGVPLLTLFRCTMRTKAKWWFISHADQEKPGTDKDIDYYLHKSGPDDEREPPARGWTRLNTTVALLGVDPPPTVKRGELVIAKGMTREAYADFQLLRMCSENSLLAQIFGPSIHREIVARSGRLLVFLAEYEHLRVEDLQLIWRAAMQNSEVDIVDEVFAVLVLVAPSLSDELFAALMGLANEALTEHHTKVAHFLEKFAADHFRPMSNLTSETACLQLLSLVWAVYRHAQFDTLKNATIVQDLLAHCLNQKEGPRMVVERIRQCQVELSEFAVHAAGAVNEAAVARLIRSLNFLISKHVDAGMVEVLNREDLATGLVIELGRYLTANRRGLESGAVDLTAFRTQLLERLDILRKFYSINPQVALPMETLRSISKLLSTSAVEQDVFFTFLRFCGKAVISVADALEVFTQFVCNPSVDWAQCGDEAFECFRTYYCELEGRFSDFPVGTELPPRLGLDTLWRIALNIGPAGAMNGAINLLLQAYDSILFLDADAYGDMLKIIFSYLEDAIATADLRDGAAPQFAPRSLMCVSRCVAILSAALAKSKGQAEVAHAVRGTMHRMHIVVYYRRVTSYYNSTTQLDMYRAEKGSEGTVRLEVHPLHTVKELKDRIAEHADLGSVTITLDLPSKELVTNSTRLEELGLCDGSEVHASYQSSFAAKSYEDDLYSDTHSTIGTTKVVHVGQVLAGNYSMFDTLLTLCEMCKDPALCRSIWQVVMLIPTQVDLMQQSIDEVCYAVGTDRSESIWHKILDGTSEARTAYLLQIVDHVLQPAAELMVGPSVVARSLQFREAFVHTNGFAMVLRILINTPADDSVVNSTTLSVALHIVHFMLFESELAQRSLDTTMDIDVDANTSVQRAADNAAWAAPAAALLEQIEACSAQVIEKLLHVARGAAAAQSSQVVHNALMVITKLIKSPEAASQLTSNPQSEVLLTTVLRSDSKKVREMAAEFAVKIGGSQPVVFEWLLAQLKAMQPADRNCSEIFTAISYLLAGLHAAATARGEMPCTACLELALILSDKLTTYPRDKNPNLEERFVLQGYLETLNVLLGLDATTVMVTTLGEQLVHSFVSEFLFAMPTEDQQDMTPICDTPATRQAAFSVLASYLTVTQDGFETVLSELGKLSKLAARHMHANWSLQVSHDIRKADMHFSGLKNQGCTCYMNSLLQLLFMSTPFREAVLATPLLEIHRTSLWHKSDIELVGNRYLFEYANGSWRPGLVVGFDPITSRHRVQYAKADGTSEEIFSFNIHEGRFQRETGRVRVIPEEGVEPLTDREEAAYRVLDQLQRAFCFMKYSKKRFFDPVGFVEACRSLNLNFNVYHQNDAAEFCDQLLDRIETATKGKHTKRDLWNDVFLKNVFGGRWLYQKIPQDCEVYNTKKEGCGHWQSSRLESFLKVELMIRGKEKVEDSLAELMQGELMDGDNKIHCEVCTQKKATVRRTCFGDLPGTLILHLKRFDLDFQTFETVKLNNRMAFPQRINMMKYTKEGIEAEERRKQAETDAAAGVEVEYEAEGAPLDPSDYDYELQGVLVHAGVAQGGHYYSFIRDGETENEWYRFDDDEVTVFDSAHIPTQCFGGPPSANSGSASGGMDEDRTSNALMLLYNKVKKPTAATTGGAPAARTPEKAASMGSPSNAKNGSGADNLVLVDGTQAYLREVRESNMQHILTGYLLDPDLHSFVRGLLSSVTVAVVPPAVSDGLDSVTSSMSRLSVLQWSPTQAADDLPLRTVQFNVSFLLDVVLHCRERAAIRQSVQVIKNAFEAFPHTALWFVSQVVDPTACTWFLEYTLQCTDALARATFVQILVAAVATIAPKDPHVLAQYKGVKIQDLKAQAASGEIPIIVCLLVRLVIDHTLKAVNYTRSADELFVLIRDLAAVPCICESLQTLGMVSFLSYFIMPDLVPVVIRTIFDKQLPQSRQQAARNEYTFLAQSIFEALAALLGVPQIRKVALLQDRPYWEHELVPEAREALATIFRESGRNGGMDTHDIAKYFERVSAGTLPKATPQQIRNILDRFATLPDGRLSFDGFLQYHTDMASHSPKLVWRDLHAFGFKNNLMRVTPVSGEDGTTAGGVPSTATTDGSSDGSTASWGPLSMLTENCRACLAHLTLYECGLAASEAATRAIARRVCHGDLHMSSNLIHQALTKLLNVACDSSWNNHGTALATEFLRLLLTIDDGLQRDRLYEILMHPKAGIAVIAAHEHTRPSQSRANEYDKFALFNKYIGFAQELVQAPGVLAALTSIAETEPKVKFVRGCLRLHTSHNLTENELERISNTVVRIERAGVPEVNGDYLFREIRFNAGFYARRGVYRGAEVTFTLYKCSLKNGGYQWFLSITPDGKEPGTVEDIDFYYALAKATDKLPNVQWIRMNPDPHHYSRDPAPTVTCMLADQADDAVEAVAQPVGGNQAESSDSDRDSFIYEDNGVDDSFVTNGSDAARDYYD